MPSIRRILTTTALCLAAVVFSVIVWAVVQLCSARVHVLGMNGKICPYAFTDIRKGDDGTYHLYMPDAIGQELYVSSDAFGDTSLTAETYVLPWFGRLRTLVNEDGYATVKISL